MLWKQPGILTALDVPRGQFCEQREFAVYISLIAGTLCCFRENILKVFCIRQHSIMLIESWEMHSRTGGVHSRTKIPHLWCSYPIVGSALAVMDTQYQLWLYHLLAGKPWAWSSEPYQVSISFLWNEGNFPTSQDRQKHTVGVSESSYCTQDSINVCCLLSSL